MKPNLSILTLIFLLGLFPNTSWGHGDHHGSKSAPKESEEGISFERGAYDPPTSNGVVRPGGLIAYDPPTSNGVVRPGGFNAYDPPTANGVVRPGR